MKTTTGRSSVFGLRSSVVAALLFVGSVQGVAQDNSYSFFDFLVDRAGVYDSCGYFWFGENTYGPGDVWSEYASLTGDALNTWVLDREWVDSFTGLHHYRYVQYFDGIPVEGGELTEHFGDNGGIWLINGKMAEITIPPPYSSGQGYVLVDEATAVQTVLSQFPDTFFTWQDSAWMAELRDSIPDYSGYDSVVVDLVWAPRDIPEGCDFVKEDYGVYWRVRVTDVFLPFFKIYYVDATTGQIAKTRGRLLDVNGEGHVWYRGVKNDLDVSKIPNWLGIKRYALRTDSAATGRNIHVWKVRVKVKRNKNNQVTGVTYRHQEVRPKWPAQTPPKWKMQDINYTSVHWFMQKTWDYYANYMGQVGMNGNKLINVLAYDIKDSEPGLSNAAYIPGTTLMEFYTFSNPGTYNGGLLISTTRCVDVAAHEFTHGITYYNVGTSIQQGLAYEKEPGAVNEFISDAMGEMVEKFVDGQNDWKAAADAFASSASPPGDAFRSLEDPKSRGQHAVRIAPTTGIILQWGVGQPDTYKGQYWFPTHLYPAHRRNDYGGVHINSGVGNYWFYLFSEGGSGTNDVGTNYNVTGVGSDRVAQVLFTAVRDYLGHYSQYRDVCIATRTVTDLKHLRDPSWAQAAHSVREAWWAVNVCRPTWVPYPATPFKGHAQTKLRPEEEGTAVNMSVESNGEVELVLPRAADLPYQVEVYTVWGQRVASSRCASPRCRVSLAGHPAGVYVIHWRRGSESGRLRVVKW